MNTDQLIYLVLGSAGLGVFVASIVCWLFRSRPLGSRSGEPGPTTPIDQTTSTGAKQDQDQDQEPKPELALDVVVTEGPTHLVRRAGHWQI
jgi:hypothetical protein